MLALGVRLRLVFPLELLDELLPLGRLPQPHHHQALVVPLRHHRRLRAENKSQLSGAARPQPLRHEPRSQRTGRRQGPARPGRRETQEVRKPPGLQNTAPRGDRGDSGDTDGA